VATTKQFDLIGTSAKLISKDNVLAVISPSDLTTVSSGIYNGGFKKVKVILNVQVPEGYSDRQLHEDPMNLIHAAQKNLNLTTDFIAMITAAKIINMSMVTRQKDGVAINVVATAGCSHGESSGEVIDANQAPGTINVMVILNGNPTDSCLVSLFLTATEAKTAAMIDYDIRSRYTGDSATGTITDSLSVAATNTGEKIELGGPASPIGMLVAACVRQAVKEAATKQDGTRLGRPITNRLKERRLPIEKLSSELSKAKGLGLNEKTLATELEKILSSDSISALFLLAAAKMDEDYQKGLIPQSFGNVDSLSMSFGDLIKKEKTLNQVQTSEKANYPEVKLPPFTKQALINIIQNYCLTKK
jgi:adenosylcobinamide amidohydrolase